MKQEKILKILNSNRRFYESNFELIEEEFEGEDGTHWVDMYIDSNPSPNIINQKDWVHQCISKDAIDDLIKESQRELLRDLLKAEEQIGQDKYVKSSYLKLELKNITKNE